MEKQKSILLTAIIIVPIALLALILTFAAIYLIDDYQQDELWRKNGLNKVGQIVCTDKTIEDDQIITEQDVYEKQVAPEEVKAGYILCKDYVIGKRAKYFMIQNQTITCQDINLDKEKIIKQDIDRLQKCQGDTAHFCPHPSSLKVRRSDKKAYTVIRDLKEDEVIRAKDLKSTEDDETKYEAEDLKNCISDKRLLVGHKNKFGLKAGDLVQSFDLQMESAEEEDAFIANRDLKTGESISSNDIIKKHFKENSCPVTAILDIDLIIGAKVLQPIKKDAVLRALDLSEVK